MSVPMNEMQYIGLETPGAARRDAVLTPGTVVVVFRELRRDPLLYQERPLHRREPRKPRGG